LQVQLKSKVPDETNSSGSNEFAADMRTGKELALANAVRSPPTMRATKGEGFTLIATNALLVMLPAPKMLETRPCSVI
jgi:hypothetical protein